MAKKGTKFRWNTGDIIITDIPARLKNIIKNAPKGDAERAEYIASKLKSKAITADEAQIIIGRL